MENTFKHHANGKRVDSFTKKYTIQKGKLNNPHHLTTSVLLTLS